MLLYEISDNGINKLPTELILPEHLLNGDDAHLCNGCFMESLGVLDEIYYLVLVLGVEDVDKNKFGRELHLYYYDTNTSNPNNKIWTKSNTILQHPYFTRTVEPDYVGCFGNAIQSIVDLNIVGNTRQSLYVSGTEYQMLSNVRPQPSSGGMVFQYLFESNTIDPDIQLLYTVQDAKLKIISEDINTPIPPVMLTDFDYYMRGFGSVFYVSDTKLAIANLTNQDTVSYPCDEVGNRNAVFGYVQVFNLVNGVWTQEYIVCTTESNGAQIYVNRFLPLNQLGSPIGFGAGLFITDNFIFINSSNNVTSVYNLATVYPSIPNLPVWSFVPTDQLDSTLTFPGPIFNRFIFFINGDLLISSFSMNPNVNVIGIYQTNNSTNLSLPTLFKSFPLLENIGTTVNSGSSTESLIGFGQFTCFCKTPDQLKTYLFINDPLSQRVIIYLY
jgi:hypothetical protein